MLLHTESTCPCYFQVKVVSNRRQVGNLLKTITTSLASEWMTWKSKLILTTPFFFHGERSFRNLELLSGVSNRHLFICKISALFSGGCVYHRCNLRLHIDANQPTTAGDFWHQTYRLWKRPHPGLPSVNLWPEIDRKGRGDDRTEEGGACTL